MSVPDTAAIATSGLTKRFGEKLALDAVSLEVRPGELVALLGPNGGGKTTLFSILATLLAPTGGEARIFGRCVVREPDAVRRALGVVFQKPSLDGKLSVEENLGYHASFFGLHGIERAARIAEALALVGLSERRGERVDRLSGGLARRADLARGLLAKPRLLLLDEPTHGLDPHARRELATALAAVRRESGCTVLLTTHLLDEADGADRVAILDRGRLVAFEAPGALKARVSGDIVTVEAREPRAAQEKLAAALGVAVTLEGEVLRVEAEDGPRLVPRVVEALAGSALRVSLARPTLDDAFRKLTGRSLLEAPGPEIRP